MLSDQVTRILAYCVLAALGVALIAWIVAYRRGTKYSWSQVPLYIYCTIMTRVQWRLTPSGRLPISDDQGAVIVCNHRSGIDPAFIAMSTSRPVHWMVAKEYCKHPALAWFFRTLASIPVNRGGVDIASTKLAIRYARGGDLVGLFPEGRINETDQFLLPGRPGAALIALKARVPVIPCYLRDTPHDGSMVGFLMMSAKAKLIVGKPIDLSDYYGREGEPGVLEELTRKFLQAIADLAGVRDYVPELAGKRWKTGGIAEPDMQLAGNSN
jgi:1-acyl-sn-glycerol-3-phosphate acyltransferase